MIPAKNHAAVTSTLQGDAVEMTVASEALAHIMSIMTNMYADPELAVVREYSTNAWDAHVAAGQTRPIEVSTPSDLRPLFIVKDWGLGLDADDIRETLSRYGASTKRDTNDATGMLGIGCKSALAYTDQFTITGVKNGQRTVVSVARDESGAGTMTVLDASATDDENGVEIAVPAQKDDNLERKARAFFSHWKPGTILLDGEQPSPPEDAVSIGEFSVVKSEMGVGIGRALILMGNVTYPLPTGYTHAALEGMARSRTVIAPVKIGAVQFAPSREALLDSKPTREALSATFDAFAVKLAAHVEAKVARAPSKAAALREVGELEAILASTPSNLRWRGEAIPTKVSSPPVLGPRRSGEPNAPLGRKRIWNTYGTARGGNGRGEASSVHALQALRGFWCVNYTNGSWSKPMRIKLESYLTAHGQEIPASVFLTEDTQPPGGDWMDEARRVDWEVVRKWRNPATAAQRESGPLNYHARTCGEKPRPHSSYPAQDLPRKGEGGLYYYVGSRNDAEPYAASAVLDDGDVIVILPSTRKAKFQRLYPHAEDMKTAAAKAALKWWKSLRPEVRAVTLEVAEGAIEDTVEASKKMGAVDDPAFARLERLGRAYDRKVYLKYRETYSELLAGQVGDAPGVRAAIQQRYPLLGQVSAWELRRDRLGEDLKIYVNAAYAARKDGE